MDNVTKNVTYNMLYMIYALRGGSIYIGIQNNCSLEFCDLVAFNNYVDRILPFFDHLSTTLTWTFFTMKVDKGRRTF